MITGTLKSKIDRLWENFWTGGITNPITVIEQISYLMFIRMFCINQERNEKKARRLNKEFVSAFSEGKEHLCWSELIHISKGDDLLEVMRDEWFPFLREEVINKTAVGKYLHNAQFMIQNGNLVVTAIEAINELPLEQSDVKGDLYEYLLSKLTTAGVAGQFRTPRHIIEAMVQMLDPKPTEFVCDPACGTAGFLVSTMEYLNKKYTSPENVHYENDENGVEVPHYIGDLLDPYRQHMSTKMFTGFDFDATMLRIAAMNLLLHGIESPQINYQDTISSSLPERYPQESKEYFDVILANPPFKGTVDASNIDASLKRVVNTKKTELLFLVLMEKMLQMGGRCGVIVPQGVLFGSSKSHVAVRKVLIENNRLEAVINLPSGVFKPYAGVATAILFFTKGGRTDNVWFYGVEADGYSLDDKRNPIEANDLPDLVIKWQTKDENKESDRSTKQFFVPKDEIINNKYDVSFNRYKETKYEEVQYDAPEIIMNRIDTLEDDITTGLKKLKGMLK